MNANVPNLGGSVGAIGLPRVRGVIRIQNNVVRENGGRALWIGETPTPLAQMALIQNNHFIGGQNSTSIFVLVEGLETLSFQGNQCLIEALPPFPSLTVALKATSANVGGNLVDLPAVMAVSVKATDALVNGNSVRSGQQALRVIGTPTPSGAVHVIVTSNLTTGILASSTGTLIRASNFPAP